MQRRGNLGILAAPIPADLIVPARCRRGHSELVPTRPRTATLRIAKLAQGGYATCGGHSPGVYSKFLPRCVGREKEFCWLGYNTGYVLHRRTLDAGSRE
jgi:hypothetical protein